MDEINADRACMALERIACASEEIAQSLKLEAHAREGERAELSDLVAKLAVLVKSVGG